MTLLLLLTLWSAEAPPQSAPAPVETSHTWYGWQTLLGILGVSVALQALPSDTDKGALNGLSAFALAAVPVAVHLAHGEPRKIGYWFAVAAGGTLLGVLATRTLSGVGEGSPDTGANRGDQGQLFAVVAGVTIAAVVDTVAFTWKTVPVTPVVAPAASKGAVLGLAARF